MYLNRHDIAGHLGKDPEVRHLDSGVVVANFPVATSEKWVEKNTGEKKQKTQWHNVVCWRGLAEVADKYLKKGCKVFISGTSETRSWQDQNGGTRYITEIIARDLQIIAFPQTDSGSVPGSSSIAPDTGYQAGAQGAAAKTELDDDDLPF